MPIDKSVRQLIIHECRDGSQAPENVSGSLQSSYFLKARQACLPDPPPRGRIPLIIFGGILAFGRCSQKMPLEVPCATRRAPYGMLQYCNVDLHWRPEEVLEGSCRDYLEVKFQPQQSPPTAARHKTTHLKTPLEPSTNDDVG